MAVTYLPIEQTLINDFEMLYPATVGGGQQKQEFQFPPIIKTNSMSGTFTEDSSNGDTNAPGVYPAFMYKGPNQREFTVETTYIIDGATWDNDKVISEVRKYRSYYFDLSEVFGTEEEEENEQLVKKAAIMMKMWGFTGPSAMPVYMSNLSITHSGPIILPEQNSLKNNASIAPTGYVRQPEAPVVRNTQYAYSMKTDVSFSLTLWLPYKATVKNENNDPILKRTWH